MTKFRNRSIAAIGAIVATFVTISAAAPAHAETRSIAVRYGDLDLAVPSDARRLHQRIHAAANDVCGRDEALLRTATATCRRAAIAQAEAGIPALKPAVQLARR